MKYNNYYLNMKTFYCVCGGVCVCVRMKYFPGPEQSFIYLFNRLSLFRVAPVKTLLSKDKVALIYKMLQLKKQIYACTVTNNNLSQELYSFNITLG